MIDTEQIEWMDFGTRVLPEQYRDQFLAVLNGVEVESQDRVQREGVGVRWRAPNGFMPMSPGLVLEAIINEFDIKPVTAVSHNLAWEAHDTTGKPGHFGDYTCTYQVLGVRTRKQALYFLDGGCAAYPVLIVNLTEPADFIEGTIDVCTDCDRDANYCTCGGSDA